AATVLGPRGGWRATILWPASHMEEISDRRWTKIRRSAEGHSSPSYPLDLPFELDAGTFTHASADGLTQPLDLGGGGAAQIDQEIAVHLRHLRVAQLETAAVGRVDQLPGLVAGRILEGRAAGSALDRLGGFSRHRDLVHLGGDGGRVA